jgi:hypothetical protein
LFAPFTNSGGGANGGSSRRWRNAHTYFCRDQHRAGDQTDPHVSGDWAAYTSGISIRYYQFSTGIDSQIPADASVLDDLLSDISGSKIAFTRITAETKSAVMVFDAATGLAPIEIDPLAGSNRVGTAIGGNTVAYIDFGLQANGELVVHDLAAGTSVQLTNDIAFDQSPSVSPDGNTVVWEHCATSPDNCDIWQAVKTGAVWTVGVVAATTSPEGNPDSNGTLVVYDSDRGSGSKIFWRPVAGGSEVQLQLAGIARNPSIASHFVCFESLQPGATTTDIFVYDMATNRIYQITNTPLVNEQLNDITVLPDGSLRVVWASDEVSPLQRNIQSATFTLPGAVAVPFADFEPVTIIDLPLHALAVAGTFTLGGASNGIAPRTEPITLQVAAFSMTIPGGSFQSNGFGGFQFKGIVNGVNIVMTIQPVFGKTYAFAAVVWNDGLSAAANPVTVKLTIGDDAGSRTGNAFFATVHHDK